MGIGVEALKTSDGYKLIAYNVKGNEYLQLFDLKKDPWERENLVDFPDQQERLHHMWQILKKEMKDAHDDLDIDKPDWGRKLGQKSYGS